jgi:hypothetical protein
MAHKRPQEAIAPPKMTNGVIDTPSLVGALMVPYGADIPEGADRDTPKVGLGWCIDKRRHKPYCSLIEAKRSSFKNKEKEMTKAHNFKVTKEQAGLYSTCCGETIEYYTSKDFGLVDSNGWYITDANGDSALNRFHSLRDAKKDVQRNHYRNLLNFIIESEKAGA